MSYHFPNNYNFITFYLLPIIYHLCNILSLPFSCIVTYCTNFYLNCNWLGEVRVVEGMVKLICVSIITNVTFEIAFLGRLVKVQHIRVQNVFVTEIHLVIFQWCSFSVPKRNLKATRQPTVSNYNWLIWSPRYLSFPISFLEVNLQE